MIRLRKATERGHFDHGWLDTWHTFSFGEYVDQNEMGFGPLRVLNEDFVAPRGGFPMHPHRDMEILTWILSGSLMHRDSLGNGSTIRPGEIQRMSAGTGIVHSEANASRDEAVHLFQIWIRPEQRGIAPGYEQLAFSPEVLRNALCLVASRDGRGGSVTLHQGVDVYATRLDQGTRIAHGLAPGRLAFVQVARGTVILNGQTLQAGDGAKIQDEVMLEIVSTTDAECLLFDMSHN